MSPSRRSVADAVTTLRGSPAVLGLWVAVVGLRLVALGFDVYLVGYRAAHGASPAHYSDSWWLLVIFLAIDAMVVWRVLHLRTCVAYVLGALLLLALMTRAPLSIASNGAAFLGYLAVLRTARKRLSLRQCS